MENTVIVSIISFAGTLIGTAGGIIASGKLTQYRLEQLEKKVDTQNKTAAKIPVIEERLKGLDRRISKIESDGYASTGYYDGC